MNQQSQAQLQAQTQAQLAALREQNNILNQQLGVQAQTHIQHLQQLLPFHQSTFNPHPPQHTPSVPEPPTPVAPQSTPPSSNATFNAEEMMQQMKNTVESSMKAFVDKNQERNMNQPPAPAPSPSQVPPPIPSHPPPPEEVLPPPQHSHRRSRSRSHRHRGAPDKRPISVPRSPRRVTPPRRTHRSSRPRSSHTRRHSTSRDPSRRPARATSVHLRSSSPRRRQVLPHNDDPDRDEPGHEPAILHPASWEHQSYHHDPSSHNEFYQHDYQSYDQPSSRKWKSWNQWKDYSKSQPRIPIHRVGSIIQKLPPNTTATMNHPTTSLPTNLSLPFPRTVHVNLHTVPDQSNLVSPQLPSLQDMFPSTCKTARERNGPVTSILPCIIQIGCELPMNSRETNVLYRTLPFHRMNLMMQWNNSIGLTPEFQAMYVRRLSNCSPAPTFFRTMTCPHAMFVNFLTPTCLHSSCHYQTSVASRCHLLLATNIITPGHSVTLRPSQPLS